jgi:hypothetical protein
VEKHSPFLFMNQKRLDQIKSELQKIPIQKILHDARSSELLSGFYSEIYNTSLCSTCPGKLAEAYSQILNLNIQNHLIMATSKYSVKNNGMIDTVYANIPGVPLHITNANITDEIAEKLIAANPNFKNQLLKSSEAGEPKTEKEAAPEPTATELRSEEFDSLMSPAEIKAALKELEIPFAGNASKATLVKLLAESSYTIK